MKKKLFALLPATALAAVLALSACGSNTSSAPNPYDLITPGTIQAAASGDQPPFAKVDAGGHPAGFVIDITEEVANRLGLKVSYKSSTVPAAIQGLTSGQYDLAASGLGITDERQKSVSFAKGLYWSTTAVLTKSSNPAATLDAFAGKKVGVVTGAVQAAFVEKKMPGAVMTQFEGQNAGVSQLNSGSIDAFVVGGPDAEAYLKQFPDLKIAVSAPVEHATTVAFKKGNAALVNAWDKEVQTMVDDGSYGKIYAKYFTEAPLPQLISIWPGLK
ncbi:MAG: transporter substrate-binding domain-containing protein [Specibacter sp.]